MGNSKWYLYMPFILWKEKEAVGKIFSRENSFIGFALVSHFYYTQNVYKDKKGIYLTE